MKIKESCGRQSPAAFSTLSSSLMAAWGSGERSDTKNNKLILNQLQSHIFLPNISRGSSNCCAPFRL